MFVRGISKVDLYILNNSGKREKRQIAERERERGREITGREGEIAEMEIEKLKVGKLQMIKLESLQELRYIHF